MKIFWPESLAQQLAELWNSTSLSATEIGKKVGRTRNAVLGKLHRMELLGTSARKPGTNNQSYAPKKRKPARRPAKDVSQRPRPQPGTVLLPSVSVAAALNIPFNEIGPDQCRYMAGNDRICCGLPTVPHQSWCPTHYHRVFRNAS